MKRTWWTMVVREGAVFGILLAALAMPAGVIAASQPLLVTDIYAGTGSSFPQYFTGLNNMLFFAASDPASGRELWKSDGTAAGTMLVKDINPGAGSSSPSALTNVNGTLFFVATHPATGTELWKTDGTPEGTVLVKDINAGSGSSYPSYMAAVNGTLFFRANNALWKSDGTEAGTVLVKEFTAGPDGLIDFGGTLFFAAYEPASGKELWKSDGTAEGTVLVRDIYPGSTNGSPMGMMDVNGTLFFVAEHPASGQELWRSDGTEAGTVLVKDISPGTANASPSDLTNVGGTLYFRVYGNGLWKSDGTAGGTVFLRGFASNPGYFCSFDERLFFSASDGINGQELWTSDGTADGTLLIKDLNAGAGNSYPVSLTRVGDRFYFSATDATSGRELWTSDGTADGTALVSDIYPGLTDSSPSQFVPFRGNLMFVAADATHGQELHLLDLTAPSAQIASPSEGETLSGGETVALSGTAGDDMAGLAGVEVSTDGGANWATATDTSADGDWSTWAYSWMTPTAGGSRQLLARAVDRSGNVGESDPGLTVNVLPIADRDGDAVSDESDNCPYLANGGQEDSDGDAAGDVCDPDDDNDGIADAIDRTPLIPGYFPAPAATLATATYSGQVSVDEMGTRGSLRDGAAGDELAAFDGTDTLCGHAVVEESGNYTLTVYGDDPGTPEDEGAEEGETLTVRMWDGQRQQELPVRSLNVAGTARSPFVWSDNGGGTVDLHGLAQQQIGVFRPGNARWYADADGNGLWGGLDFFLTGFGISTDKVAAGDWNGDELLDPGAFRNKNGQGWWYFDSNGSGVWEAGLDQALQFGLGTDIPAVGDWNGDGLSDFGVFRNINGLGWWYFDSNGNRQWDPLTDQKLQFGLGTDIPVVGDWNGDGQSDFGVFRNVNGLGWWYFDSNGNRQWDSGVDQKLQFGLPGDLPVAGDWNGDGLSDFGVMRNGVWYLDSNGNRAWNSGVDLIYPSFGLPGDQPFAGVWK